MSEPDDRPLPWAELLLSLPLIAFVAYAAGVRGFPWPAVLFYWLIGAGIGFQFARSRGFRPVLGILAGMLLCFPLNLLLFLIDPRKPRPSLPTAQGLGALLAEAPGAPPVPAPPQPGRSLAKASAFLGISGFLCWGLCGLTPILGFLLGLVALALSTLRPDRYGGRGLALLGIASSLALGFLVFTGPVPRPTNDMLRWDQRTDKERAVVQALRSNVGRTAAAERPEPPEELSRVNGWQFAFRPGPDREFAFLAIPVERRFWKRLDEEWWRPPRAFCADDTGRVCQVDGGLIPRATDGRCPPSPDCADR